MRYTLDFPTVPHYPPSAPRSLNEDTPLICLPFPTGGSTHTTFPSPFPMCTMGTLSAPTKCRGFIWAGPGWLADSLLLTRQVAATKFTSHCFHFWCPVLPAQSSFNLSGGLWVIGNVIHPINAVFLSPGIYEVILEVSPDV